MLRAACTSAPGPSPSPAHSALPKRYSVHDPYSGDTKIRTEAQMRQGNLDIAGSNQITAFENPTKVPVK